jgi:hypothetical protein
MKNRSSTKRRLGNLEVVAHQRAIAAYRDALIEICGEPCPDGQHLVLTGSYRGRCFFREVPGPGPQLVDFGEFGSVLYMTAAELEIPCDP